MTDTAAYSLSDLHVNSQKLNKTLPTSTISYILYIALFDTYLNHASRGLNMLKPETSRFPRVMISECTRILTYFQKRSDDIWESLHIRRRRRYTDYIILYCRIVVTLLFSSDLVRIPDTLRKPVVSARVFVLIAFSDEKTHRTVNIKT